VKLALTPIVERLRDQGLTQVQGVLELGRQDAPPRTLPAFYVVPVSERGAANALDVARDQAIDCEFAVLLVVDGARRNEAGIADAVQVEGERVKDALVGWAHPAASRACGFSRASLGSASGPVVTWDMRFTARYHLRRNS